ncbi:MAG: mycofactocin-associated electron transfer flavoprotein beta subunit [Ilumatobacteraceae bacterium]
MSDRSTPSRRIAVCWKWVDLEGDARRAGVSDADEAALESALTLATSLENTEVTVVALGPPAVDTVLRGALAAGAHGAIRIDASVELRSDRVAAALAGVLRQTLHDVDIVVCGDYSPDRGSGSVPAFLAAELGAAQALGLIDVTVDGRVDASGAPVLRALRRLDGGRREQLSVTTPAVLSVEGSVAALRRATLPAELAAKRATIEVVPGPAHAEQHADSIRPFRPRPRVVPAPEGQTALERVRALTDAGATVAHGENVVLDPPAAAARILTALHEWGYLAPDDPRS